VKALFTAEEILEIASARVAAGILPSDAGSICTDTRLINQGDWFLALPGASFDGHDFLGDAFAGGAIGCIVSERTGYSIGNSSFPLLAVADTDYALKALSTNWRKRINPTVGMVCGAAENVERLVHLIAGAAAIDKKTVNFSGCIKSAREASQMQLAMPGNTRLSVVGFCPNYLREIEHTAAVLEPNLLAFLPLAFENLRLTSQPKELANVPLKLLQHVSKNWAWVLNADSGITTGLMRLNEQFNLLVYGERFFDMKGWWRRRQLEEPGGQWAEVLIQEPIEDIGPLSLKYSAAITYVQKSLSDEEAWLCVNACGLVGINLSAIAEAPKLKRQSSDN